MTRKSIDFYKMLDYLKEHGSIKTAEWYAQQLDMPIKNAQYMVAYRIFRENEEDEEFDDSVIDITLCRFLWQKFVGDKEIAEIIKETLALNKFDRRENLEYMLYKLKIEYPKQDRVIDAIYYAVPELRTVDPGNAGIVINSFYKRMSLQRTYSTIVAKESTNEYDKDFFVEDNERYEEGSSSEMWYNFYDDNMMYQEEDD